MNNEFTQKRIRTLLSQYEQKLNALIENEGDWSKTELVQKVEELMSDLNSEKELAAQTLHDLMQESHCIPAIDEALSFLAQSLNVPSRNEFNSKLQDAAFSLGYYRHH